MNTSLAIATRPSATPVEKDSRTPTDRELFLWFCVLCAVVSMSFRLFGALKKQSKENLAKAAKIPAKPPAEVTALVGKLAEDTLGIGPHQLGEPIEKLRIPRGDFLSFLDDLEQDHGLQVPASARTMSISISGVISAVCKGT